jgi:RHS repeat-associated protein
VDYVYDYANRMSDLYWKHSGYWIAREHFTVDGMNRLWAVAHYPGSSPTPINDSYSYDDAGQITNANYGWGNPMGNGSYVWDNAGNRTLAGGKVYTSPHDGSNQYTTVGGDTITNGSEHEISIYKGMIYHYYGDTYLASVSGGGSTYQLYYDALGRCIERKLDGVPSYYLYDGEHWIMEYDGTGVFKSNVLYGLGIDEILGRGVNGGEFPLPDRNGNTAFVTGAMASNGVAVVKESYRYDAFGTPKIYNGANAVITSSAIGNRFLFTGREYNSQFGFYEYRARAYHPGLGRFMSEDPKGFDAGDYNFFRYCENDPWDKSDPMGLDLVPVGDADATARWNQAYAAWAASPTIGPLLSVIKNSGVVVPVVLHSNPLKDGLDSIRGKLYYDPYHGGELKEGGTNSPGVRGAHEISHVERWLRDPNGYDKDTSRTDRRSIATHKATMSNPEEERALKVEQRYARERGEPARPRYEQYKSYPETQGVNSNVPKDRKAPNQVPRQNYSE